MNADGKSDTLPVDETTPEMRDIHFTDILCAGAKQAIYINGLPELPVSNITFANSSFTASKGAEVHFAEGISFDNVLVNGNKL